MICPYKDRIIFEDPAREHMSPGGIILLKSTPMGIYRRARAVAVGDQVKDIVAGDVCFFDNIAAVDVEGGRLSVDFMVLAVVKEEDAFYREIVRPLRDWILLEKPIEREASRGGIIYWDVKSKNKFVKSRVKAVGPKVRDVKYNDMVYHKNMTQMVVEDKYYFITEGQALALEV
jgi:co-chaperonin GroES (HSP10)